MEPQTPTTAETTRGAEAAHDPYLLAGWTFAANVPADDVQEIARARWRRRNEGFRRLKTGAGRTVFRIELNRRGFVFKLICCTGLAGRIRRALRVTPADREWRFARALERCGVDAVRFIAHRRGPQSILVSPEIERAVTLSQAWSQTASDRAARTALIHALARAHVALHRAGFVHMDNHPENHLVSSAPRTSDPAPRVVLADVGSIERGSTPRQRIASLAQAAHAMTLRASRSDRLRLLRAYLAEFGGGQPKIGIEFGRRSREECREWAHQIERAAEMHAFRLYRQRDRALRRPTGRYFVQHRKKEGASGMAVTRWSRRAHFADPALEDNSRADASRRLELLLDKLALNAGADERIDPLIRPYAWSTSSLVEKLSWRVAGSPARRLFSAAHYRRFRDLDHPRVLAFGEYLRGSEYRAVALVADE